jgi:hypothetical protein
VSGVPPEMVAALRKASRFARLLADAMEELEALLPSEAPSNARPGRPAVVATRAEEEEILRLRFSNGRLGYRAIGARVGVSWRVVGSTLDTYASSQNPANPSQNPSTDSATHAPSKASRKGGDAQKKRLSKSDGN